MLNELSLFSGYGGFSLGLRLAGVETRTVAYVEWEPYCQQIIQARIEDGYLDDAPIYGDIRAFDGKQCRGMVDIITGGFPCQDLSVAGKQAGLDGTRSGLWWEMLRCIREVGPKYVFIENVPGILAGGQGSTVVGELAAIGYDCIWHLLPAAATGAPHLRWRWWCLAYASDSGYGELFQHQSGREREAAPNAGGNDEVQSLAYTDTARLERRDGEELRERSSKQPARPSSTLADASDEPVAETSTATGTVRSEWDAWSDARRSSRGRQPGTDWWEVEPQVGRVADGHPHRVDELKALGNGIVPAVVAEFLRRLA